MESMSVSEAARRLGAHPKDISDLFYRRELRDDIAPIVGTQRVIPEKYLPTIRAVLERHGRPVGTDAVQ
ncbi:MAG: hypothetical protein KJ749_03990 [Planctomycetes bacterium]|nr:hypothetical protein [Planctomycetota bacterium]